ncbi:hypothetical protein ABT173_48185, partial [Streptomyces sp. NPDC001795]
MSLPAGLFPLLSQRELETYYGVSEWTVRQWTEKALAGATAVADFKDLPNHGAPTGDPWASTATRWGNRAGTDQREWFTELVNRENELRHASAPVLLAAAPGLSHDDSTPRDTRRDLGADLLRVTSGRIPCDRSGAGFRPKRLSPASSSLNRVSVQDEACVAKPAA